jgi:TorA-specific chaperone
MREQTPSLSQAGKANALDAPARSVEEHAGWATVWESESLLCRWLATLLGAELDEGAVASYRKGEAAPFLEFLRDGHGLQEETARLEVALGQLVMFTTPHLELAADFAALFLGDARSGAPLYASLYADEQRSFFGAPTERMEVRLSRAGYAVRRDVDESADHLAVMLDYLAIRCMTLAKTEEAERRALRDDIGVFLEQDLCSWLPQLVARSAQVQTASDCYPALLALTAAYCRHLVRII